MSLTPNRFTTRAESVVARCRRLASFSEDPRGICRTFLSEAMRDCQHEVAQWMRAAGAEVAVDAAGNLRGLYSADRPGAPRLLVGSHLDTVPKAGAYDGVLGVVLAIALLEALEGQRLSLAVEIIAFSEEEGVRFGAPFIGSRALVGRLDEELLSLRDRDQISVRSAIANFGLDPAQIPAAALKNDTLAYLEFHIEQGPILESLGLPLGVVEAIAGQTREEFVFTGRSNHAGTTPMHLRHDALAGAAEWITVVEQTAQNVPGLVATVGSVKALPGAVNVIAGEARATLDLRHRSDDVRERAANQLSAHAQEIAERRGLCLQRRVLLNQPAVPMDAFLVDQISDAIRKTGCETNRMTSGAGHDAMILAEKVPAAMIFLRTPGGISHDPAESVLVEDVAKALECGTYLFHQLATSSDLHPRTTRA